VTKCFTCDRPSKDLEYFPLEGEETSGNMRLGGKVMLLCGPCRVTHEKHRTAVREERRKSRAALAKQNNVTKEAVAKR
jgi:hypothetical protein